MAARHAAVPMAAHRHWHFRRRVRRAPSAYSVRPQVHVRELQAADARVRNVPRRDGPGEPRRRRVQQTYARGARPPQRRASNVQRRGYSRRDRPRDSPHRRRDLCRREPESLTAVGLARPCSDCGAWAQIIDRSFGAAREAPAGGVALHTRVLATEEVKYAATSAASCSGVQGEGMLMGNKQCAKCAGNILTWQVPGAARRHICAGRTRRRVYWFGCSEA